MSTRRKLEETDFNCEMRKRNESKKGHPVDQEQMTNQEEDDNDEIRKRRTEPGDYGDDYSPHESFEDNETQKKRGGARYRNLKDEGYGGWQGSSSGSSRIHPRREAH